MAAPRTKTVTIDGEPLTIRQLYVGEYLDALEAMDKLNGNNLAVYRQAVEVVKLSASLPQDKPVALSVKGAMLAYGEILKFCIEDLPDEGKAPSP
jgi:hypothetical protein